MYEIKRHLVAMAETVFIIQQDKTSEGQHELVLDDNELVEVVESES